MTPQQHLKAALEKHGMEYFEPHESILEAMRAHTNEVLGELEKWIVENDELGLGVAGIGDLKAKIQSLKT